MWSILIYVLLALHVAICLLLVLVVLMQRPRSEGLGAAFGGGVTENIFGAQTTHVLGKFTTWLGIGFFIVTLFLSMAYARKDSGQTALQKELLSVPAPVAAPAPSATPAAAIPAASVEPSAPPAETSAPSPEPAASAAPSPVAAEPSQPAAVPEASAVPSPAGSP